MIGKVYHIKTHEKDYMFKLYRSNQVESALSSVKVMTYLNEHSNLVPKIYQTSSNQFFVEIDDEIGVLFDYIVGEHADKIKHENLVIKSIKAMHDCMKTYPYSLEKRNEKFYIDRYLNILSKVAFDQEKINELETIGKFFFHQVKHLEEGYCHGDMHTGNVIINKDQQAIILDFDVCGILSPLVDYVTYFDQTHFNQFSEKDINKTIKVLENQSWIDTKMIKYMIAMIPVRHYEIIATILNVKGYGDGDYAFFEEQYKWIKSFYEIYQKMYKKRKSSAGC